MLQHNIEGAVLLLSFVNTDNIQVGDLWNKLRNLTKYTVYVLIKITRSTPDKELR